MVVEASGRRREVSRRTYTEGDVNKLIDSCLHPFARQKAQILILDGLIHALVEQDPLRSASKFLAYSMPRLVSQLGGGDKRIEKATKNLVKQTMKLARTLRKVHGQVCHSLAREFNYLSVKLE